MIEQKSFQIPEHSELDLIADLLNQAFADGWQYISHFPVGRGVLVVLARGASTPEYNELMRQQVAGNGGVPKRTKARR